MHIEVGADCLDQLAPMLKKLGSERVLLLTSPSRRHLDRALQALRDFRCSVFDGAVVHVPEESVSSALEYCDFHRADTLVAIGGGAGIGLGKALCLARDLTLVANQIAVSMLIAEVVNE